MRDEFEKIEWLKRRFELEDGPQGLVLGIGDDAAIVDFGDRPTVITVDAQVEGVHFRFDLISYFDVGYRALVTAASDVWAMGAIPNACVVALSLPSSLADGDFRELVDGMAEASRASGARVIGGNLSGGPSLSVATTVFGVPTGDPVLRDGAEPGDDIYVTGTIGAAALGLAILDSGRTDLEGADGLIERWRRPPMNGPFAKVIADVATASVDLSDGCLQDLGHVCRSSRVGAILRADAVPLAHGHVRACDALGLNPIELALTGGEDYELLFTTSPSSEPELRATKIGTITDDREVRVIDAEGRPIEMGRTGFRHFS